MANINETAQMTNINETAQMTNINETAQMANINETAQMTNINETAKMSKDDENAQLRKSISERLILFFDILDSDNVCTSSELAEIKIYLKEILVYAENLDEKDLEFDHIECQRSLSAYAKALLSKSKFISIIKNEKIDGKKFADDDFMDNFYTAEICKKYGLTDAHVNIFKVMRNSWISDK